MAFPRDVVAEQAQTAPLLNNLSSPLSAKRSLLDDDPASSQAKKKRESLLGPVLPSSTSIAKNKGESDSPESSKSKMPVATNTSKTRDLFTKCSLCDLQFQTELELEEHLYSMLHHRALDTEKGKDFVHECNICCAKCKGLAEYVNHLRQDEHRQNVEKRKDDFEKNRKTGPVFGLIRYRGTFMYPPTKRNQPPENSSEQSHDTSRSAEFKMDAELYRNNKPPSFSGRYFPSSNPFDYTPYENMRDSSQWQYRRHGRDGDFSSSQFNSSWNWSRNPRGSAFHRQYATSPELFRSRGTLPPSRLDHVNHQFAEDRFEEDGVWFGSHQHPAHGNYNETNVYPDNRLMDRSKDNRLANDNHIRSRFDYRRLGNRSARFDESMGRYQPLSVHSNNDNSPRKWKKILHHHKLVQDGGNSPSKITPRISSKITTNNKNLQSNSHKSLDNSNSSVTKRSPVKKSSSSGEARRQRSSTINRKSSRSMPGISLQQLRRDLSGNAKVSKKPSKTSSSTSKPKLGSLSNLSTSKRLKTIKNLVSAPSSCSSLSRNSDKTNHMTSCGSQSNSTTSSAERAETHKLRQKFRSVMDEIEPPSSGRSVSSSVATISSVPLHGVWSNAVRQRSYNTDFNCLDATSDRRVSAASNSSGRSQNANKIQGRGSKTHSDKSEAKTSDTADYESSLSPSEIREKLLELAMKKDEEKHTSLEPSDEVSDSFVPSSTDDSKKQEHDDKSDEWNEANKKKNIPKPNIAHARSRLKADQQHQQQTQQQQQSCSGDAENENKQARLAKLLLQVEGRSKPNTDPITKLQKRPNVTRQVSGPRFGIGLLGRDVSLDTGDIDMEEIVSSIKEAENLGEVTPSKTKRTRSVSEGEKTSSPSHPHQTRHPSDDSHHTQPQTKDEPTVQRKRSDKEDLSTRLLQMSEREELLHSHDSQINERSGKLHQEIAHVDILIEQLITRKKELEGELMKIDEEGLNIKKDLENIRQERLALLRGTVNSSSAKPTPPIHSPARPSSCTHSTPTTTIKPDLTPTTIFNSPVVDPPITPSFPDSQSTIGDVSRDHSRYDTATNGIDLILSRENAQVVKEESEHELRLSQLPSADPYIEPFPVPSGSAYAPNLDHPEANALGSSIDSILRKYNLKPNPYIAEREVTSSTMPQARSAAAQLPAALQTSSDTEVTSTTHANETPHQFFENLPSIGIPAQVNSHLVDIKPVISKTKPANSPHKKKVTLPKDPHLKKLTLEQPSSSDVTKSWVTAHDVSFEPTNKNYSTTTQEENVPVNLTSEQCSILSLNSVSIQQHNSAILHVYVTPCGKLITCSKDKTLCICEAKTGQLLKRYDLPGIPFKAVIASDESAQSGKQGSLLVTLFVVFVDDTHERNLLWNSCLHQLHVKITDSSTVREARYKFTTKKLHEHDCCILSMHLHRDILYLGGRDGRVAIFCTKSQRVKDVLDCHSPHSICCLTTGTDGARRILCCGSSDCNVSVRDADDGLLLKTLIGHTKTVNCVEIKTNLVYSGASDRSVLIHNIHTGDILYRFLGIHGGSVKALYIHHNAIVSLCLDKSVRVLKTEPCRISGPPKALSSLPLSMYVHVLPLEGGHGSSNVLVPFAFVGCQDGYLLSIPLFQLAYSARKLQSEKTDESLTVFDETETTDDFQSLSVGDIVSDLHCKWNGCGATGFTNAGALLTHVNLFHATDQYKESLNSCCLWGKCTHYFSSDLDTALDVHLHMDQHVHDAVTQTQHRQ